MLDGLSHSTWALTTAHLAGRRRRLSASLFQETAHQLENIPSAGRLHQNAVEAGFIRPLLHFVPCPAGRARIFSQVSKPLRPGMPTSSSTASGLELSTISMALQPSAAVSTWCPCLLSSIEYISRVRGPSSTIRMRQPGVLPSAPRSDSAPVCGCCDPQTTGSDTETSLPNPSPALRASTLPPCNSTSLRVKLSPSPNPLSARSSERSI